MSLPTPASAHITYVSVGGTPVPHGVPFPYLDKSHVRVYVNGALQATTAYTWPTDSSIQFNTEPAAGSTIEIRRTTPVPALTQYQTGATLTEGDLETDSLQALYLIEEEQDIREVRLQETLDVAVDFTEGAVATEASDRASAIAAEVTARNAAITAGNASTLANANAHSDAGDAALDADKVSHSDLPNEILGLGGDAAAVSFKATPGTDSIARPVSARLKESLSVKDFGAVGDGVADDRAAIQAAINAVAANGGGSVDIPEGTFDITAPLVGAEGITVRGVGGRSKIRIRGLSYAFNTQGALSADLTNVLSANANVAATTLSLTSGKGANFVEGDYILVTSEAGMPQGACTNKRGEIARVQSVAGDVLTLESQLVYAYATADSARVRKISFIRDFAIEDLTIDGDFYEDETQQARGQTVFAWCLRPRVSRVRFRALKNQGVIFGGCFGGIVESCQFDDLQSAPDDVSGGFGYAILETCVNAGNRVINCTAERPRHLYTTTDSSTPFAPGYGQPHGSRIIGCTALWPRAAGFDTHEAGLDISFTGCTVIGGQRMGFQIRSLRASFEDCVVSDCIGEAIFIDSSAEDCVVSNLRASRTNNGTVLGIVRSDKGAVYDNGLRSIVRDSWIENCGGPGIEAGPSATGFAYERNLIRNACQITTANQHGIFINTTAAIDVDLHGNRIVSTDGKTATGIKASNSNTAAFATGNNVRGATTAYSFSAAVQAIGNLPSNFLAVGQAAALTISSGVLDISSVKGALVSVLGEGGASDDLVTINGGMTGQKITFKRGAAVNITFKATGGNIQLKASADRILGSSFANITLRKDGTIWVEDGI